MNLRRWFRSTNSTRQDALATQLGQLRRDLETRLDQIDRRLFLLDYFSNGSRGTYLGNGRVLVKTVVAGHQIAFLLQADDLLISPWFIVSGMYETPLTDFFVRELKPDSHCVDVGANFGYFTCLMSRLCPQGHVIGVEPDDAICALTCDNIMINGLQQTGHAIKAAANDTGNPIMLYRRRLRSGNTSIAKPSAALLDFHGEADSEPFNSPGITVDALLDRMNGRIDFLKIDAEGAEPLVIKGAAGAIRNNPQLTIVMEWSPGQIRDAGFKVTDFTGEIRDCGLGASDLETGQPICCSDLATIPYRPGIVLRRPT